MIEIKEAVRVTMDYMTEFYREEQRQQLTLEEVELSGDEKSWLVTVSFARPFAKSPIEAMAGQQATTTYKILEIDAEGGQVRSMKTRKI